MTCSSSEGMNMYPFVSNSHGNFSKPRYLIHISQKKNRPTRRDFPSATQFTHLDSEPYDNAYYSSRAKGMIHLAGPISTCSQSCMLIRQCTWVNGKHLWLWLSTLLFLSPGAAHFFCLLACLLFAARSSILSCIHSTTHPKSTYGFLIFFLVGI